MTIIARSLEVACSKVYAVMAEAFAAEPPDAWIPWGSINDQVGPIAARSFLSCHCVDQVREGCVPSLHPLHFESLCRHSLLDVQHIIEVIIIILL